MAVQMKTCDLCRRVDPNGYRRVLLGSDIADVGIRIDICYNCYKKMKTSDLIHYPEKAEVILDGQDSSV